MSVTYNQEVKNQARERLLEHAIQHLTTKRVDSFLLTKDHFEKITATFNTHLAKCIGDKGFDFLNQYNWMFYGLKESWYNFYDSTCKPKTAADLKVLYLSGPEPLNDIEVLCNHGIRLENIWAVESEKDVYQSAISSLIAAGIHIKMHRGKLEEFFELVNHEFDIIYYDACTPVISPKSSPLDILKQIFINKRLTGLSALITNFAEPKDNYNWGDILGCWFSTKEISEVPEVDNDISLEFYQKKEFFSLYSQHINDHLHDYYDKFLTHFISSFAGEMMPIWQTIALGSVQNNYLLNEQRLFKKLDEIRNYTIDPTKLEDLVTEIPHYLLAVDAYPLLNWALHVRSWLPKEHTIQHFLNSKRKAVTLEDALYIGTLLKRFEEADTDFNTFILEICSERLKSILANLDFFDRYLHITCDMPMKNLLVELIYGLYGYPHIAHTGKTLAFKYRAKETWMFSNVFIFDQCRYLYDYLPTLDLWENYFENYAHQTIIKGCIDGIHRNHLNLNSSLFTWGFMEDIYGKFGAPSLPKRINLNSVSQ